MLDVLFTRWYLLTVRGALSIAFGMMVLFWSQLTVAMLAGLFVPYVIVDGAVAIGFALRMRGRPGFSSLMCEAIVCLAAACVAVAFPGITSTALLIVISSWVLLRGMAAIWLAIELREEVSGDWPLPLMGAVSILWGPLMMLRPEQGALAVSWMIGLYALAAGSALMILGLRFRRFADEIPAM